MNEIIESIDNSGFEDDEGFVIVTNKQTICIGIRSGQSCCEEYGSFCANEDPQEFIGAELLSVAFVDESLETTEIERFTDTTDIGRS